MRVRARVKNKMIQYVYEFLSILFDKLKDSAKIRNIILFGSFARVEQKENSDIDLFIDISKKDKKEIAEITKEALAEFEIKIKNSWKLKGIKNVIVPIVDDINEKKWISLKNEISSYGIVLYGKYHIPLKKQRQSVIIEYDLSKKKQKEKMKVLRELYGYKLKVKNKVYEQKGMVDEIMGNKISNAIMLDIKYYKKVYDFLRKNKIPLKIRRLWLE